MIDFTTFNPFLSSIIGFGGGVLSKIINLISDKHDLFIKRTHEKDMRVLDILHHHVLYSDKKAKVDAKYLTCYDPHVDGDKLNRTSFSRRMLVGTSCAFMMGVFVLAYFHIPFTIFEPRHLHFLGFDFHWTKRITFDGFPLLNQFLDVLVMASSFILGGRK